MSVYSRRVRLALDQRMLSAVRQLAKRDRVSVSLKLRDLVRQGVELEEDLILAAIAKRRDRTFYRDKWLSHKQIWRNQRS